jgi:tight adherence protein B
VSPAVVLAAVAGACGVLAAWEALIVAEQAQIPRRAARALRPLVAAGRSGRAPTSPERRRLAVLVALGLLAGGWLVAGPLAGVLLAGGGPWAAAAVLRARERRWRAQLARGAPCVARALADALAGGHSVRGAIAEAAATGGVPGAAGLELRRVAAALALGESTEEALAALARRACEPAHETIVAAILLQREAGGDLASLLRTVARSLEAAGRVRAEARSATAQARSTASVVAALPAGALALTELAQPGHLANLVAAPLPAVLAAAALALEVVALLLVRRLARVPA